MLESIVDIGGSILNSKDVWESQLLNVSPKDKKDRQKYVVKIDFSTKEDKMSFDCSEEVDTNTAKKYLAFSRMGGPNSRQWLATHSSSYLISEVINQLYLRSISEKLNEALNIILERYFNKFEKADEKYQYLLKWNIEGSDIIEEYTELLENQHRKKSGDFKNFLSKLDKAVKKNIADEFEIHTDQLGPFTLSIDGEVISRRDDYRKYLIKYFSPNNKDIKQKNTSCSICGNPSCDKFEFDIKFYTTNQMTFSSGLAKKYDVNNFSLCSSCADSLKAGENFIKTSLKVRLAGIDTYIIPQIVFGDKLEFSDLNIIASRIKDRFYTANYGKTMEGIEKLDNEIENIYEDNDDEDLGYYYLMNFFMYKASNQAVKVKKIIRNIHPSIFDHINKSIRDAKEILKKYYREDSKNTAGLNRLYYSIPITVDGGSPRDFRFILDIYESTLSRSSIDIKRLIKAWNKTIKVVYLDQNGYNVSPKEGYGIESKFRDIVFAYKFLESLGCIKKERGESMDLDIKDVLKEYVGEMGFDEEQTSLFLLGYLMGQIGNQQAKRSTGDIKNKPILNKLNFNGMDKKRLIRLSTEVFNKLRQEKILQYNEKTYYEMTRLMNMKLNNWSYSSDENLFYILSGFSFKGYKKDKGGEEQND
jgi:CRISPR-associated protein Csh1